MPADEISSGSSPAAEPVPQPHEGGAVPRLRWRRGTRCAVNGSCVEIAELPDGGIAVRDGKLVDESPILCFGRDEWATFILDVRAGELGPP